MVFDSQLILRAGQARTDVNHLGTATSVAAAATMTQTGYTSGWTDLINASMIPDDGLTLAITLPGNASGNFTSTGATGTAAIVVTVTYSDDGTNAIANLTQVSKSRSYTFASSVSAGGEVVYMELPRVPHRYFKVAIAVTLGTITGVDFGTVQVGLTHEPDVNAWINIG